MSARRSKFLWGNSPSRYMWWCRKKYHPKWRELSKLWVPQKNTLSPKFYPLAELPKTSLWSDKWTLFIHYLTQPLSDSLCCGPALSHIRPFPWPLALNSLRASFCPTAALSLGALPSSLDSVLSLILFPAEKWWVSPLLPEWIGRDKMWRLVGGGFNLLKSNRWGRSSPRLPHPSGRM